MIPEWFDYTACSGLSREMVEKLGRVRPATLGQASRIQGVTPAAVSLVNCFIEIQGQRRTASMPHTDDAENSDRLQRSCNNLRRIRTAQRVIGGHV